MGKQWLDLRFPERKHWTMTKKATKKKTVVCYDYVNHPYEQVCEALIRHGNEIFHAATKSAETRAESVAAGLHVKIAGIEFGKE
mgnify:CR=1 FL=1